jgi:hypothetical protein
MEDQHIRLLYAQALFVAGYGKEAEALLRQLVSEDPGNIIHHGALGLVAAFLGDRETARAITEYLRNLDRPYLFGHHLYWQAAIAAQLGKREVAVDLLREGFARGLSFLALYRGDLHHSVYFFNLRHYAPFQELMRPK